MSKTLSRADIVESIYNQLGLPKKSSAELVEILLDMMKAALVSGEDVMITGFGKFSVKNKRERRGRNPATGEDLMLAPRKLVTFKLRFRHRNHEFAIRPKYIDLRTTS